MSLPERLVVTCPAKISRTSGITSGLERLRVSELEKEKKSVALMRRTSTQAPRPIPFFRQGSFPFVQLPDEIRNLIYDELFGGLVATFGCQLMLGAPGIRSRSLGLLLSSRAMRGEVLQAMFSRVKQRFTDIHDKISLRHGSGPTTWITTIRQPQFLHHLELSTSRPGNCLDLTMGRLESCPNLKRLHLELFHCPTTYLPQVLLQPPQLFIDSSHDVFFLEQIVPFINSGTALGDKYIKLGINPGLASKRDGPVSLPRLREILNNTQRKFEVTFKITVTIEEPLQSFAMAAFPSTFTPGLLRHRKHEVVSRPP